MANFGVAFATKLVVGSEIGAGVFAQKIPYENSISGGLTVINGPAIFGIQPAFPGMGVVNIGPSVPTSGIPATMGLMLIHPAIGMNVTAPIAANFTGIVNTFGPKNNFGPNLTFGLKQTLGIFSKIGKGVEVGGTVKAEPKMCEVAPIRKTAGVWNHSGLFNLTGVGNVAVAINSKKGFDIEHPTKKGWRLSHICPEAPTADVYFRGKHEGSDPLYLPEYWNGLVDPESITVQLTPVGSYQELFVEKVVWGKQVIIKNNVAGPIKCHYIVHGERIDTEKNIHEYEGTWDDYPGDNATRSVVGKDYDRRAA